MGTAPIRGGVGGSSEHPHRRVCFWLRTSRWGSEGGMTERMRAPERTASTGVTFRHSTNSRRENISSLRKGPSENRDGSRLEPEFHSATGTERRPGLQSSRGATLEAVCAVRPRGFETTSAGSLCRCRGVDRVSPYFPVRRACSFRISFKSPASYSTSRSRRAIIS